MAIAFNQTTNAHGGAVITLSVNHAAAGTDRYALIAVYAEGGDFGSHNILNISYAGGGGSVGLIGRVGDYGELSLYQVIAPATGSQLVTVNFVGNSPRCVLGIVSYTGVDQTTPRRDTDSVYIEDVATTSLTLTSIVGDRVVDVAVCALDAYAANISQNELISLDDWDSVFRSFGMSERAGAATSTAMSWTASGATSHFQYAVSLIASAGGGPVLGTVTPTTGSLRFSYSPPSLNPFTNVRISEILINEAGSPLAGRTGMHLLVWYEGYPFGAPDLSYSNATTGAAGTFSYSLASGPLLYNSPIFYLLTDGNASGSLSGYTCARMVPTYS